MLKLLGISGAVIVGAFGLFFELRSW